MTHPGESTVRPGGGTGLRENGSAELVVLLDENLERCGVADKMSVHTEETPLHLAFSCYIRDGYGRFLMTRRALSKKTWPGVWTNSCCGHPAPGETMEEAVRRRVGEELGLKVEQVEAALPEFRYRAVSAEGIVENEFCPVFWALATDDPAPDPAEVAEYTWVDWAALVHLATHTPSLISPWAALQIPLLDTERTTTPT
ncbi:isopentenyl-diphosphate delta-isomerase [Nocardiopsis mwathae]|uniref:Isopentenyl-diphosphate Delta-isomerase n=1 Tax=Nocardiopsis mwathae TaxID=1472723 RepID=A0A7W9YM21_9ACTN|nr:isopentenyl-diphosphate Delta-isomerase [Nocardiopsis mwathae]MBB6174653.1 isopentenyl-diphosphate delta-isomerase [Nocardiopsis mwathae]